MIREFGKDIKDFFLDRFPIWVVIPVSAMGVIMAGVVMTIIGLKP